MVRVKVGEHVIRRLFVLATFAALSACSLPSDSEEAATDTNGDGFISPSEAQAVLANLKQIEFQGGEWQLTSSSPGQDSEVDKGCIPQEQTHQFAQAIAFGDMEKEIRSVPDENCKFKNLQVTKNSVEIDISCEFSDIDARSTRQVASSFSPTSFETSHSFESNDWRNFGLREGEFHKTSVMVSGKRIGPC